MAKKDNGLGYVKSLAAMFSPEVKQRVAEREAKKGQPLAVLVRRRLPLDQRHLFHQLALRRQSWIMK